MEKKQPEISNTSHKEFMKMALVEAVAAGGGGEVPVGAVLVKDGEVIASDHNRRAETGDPSAHAETLVLRAAGEGFGDWRLDGTTLYVTLEPCPMCAGAIVLARVSTVVFGASDPVAGAGGSAYNILQDGKLGFRPEVIGGILQDECEGILKKFFDGIR
jgi:tRNA(adenine34) deaminase